MKKIYFLLFAMIIGSGAVAQIDLRADLIGYSSMQATSDDPIVMDYYVINDGQTIPTGDTIFLALILTDQSSYIYNYSVATAAPTAGTVSILVLTADFNMGDTIPVTGIPPVDMQWVYQETGDLNPNICGVGYVGQTAFATAGTQGAGMETNFLNNSECVDYTVTWVTGINEADLSQIKVYPNPATDQLNIYLGENEVEYVQIMDISGRIIDNVQVTGNTEMLDVSSYQDGIYFYAIVQNGEITMTDKFVVSK